jgi:hypothetical protein
MRSGVRATLLAVVPLVVLNACSGSSSGGGGSGSLVARAVWQQPEGQAAAALPGGGSAFASPIPRAVRSVVVQVEPASGPRRCVATDPASNPERMVVIRGLPSGPTSVSILGFPVGADEALAICEGRSLGTPSYRSNASVVTIVPATRTDAGDIEVFAVPFLIALDPPASLPPSSADDPVPITFVVADAVTGIVASSVRVESTAPVLTVCDDATSSPCSDGGSLEVRGFRAQLTISRSPGAETIQIEARNLDSPARDLDFQYQITVQPGQVPTPTPTPSTSPSPTPTPTSAGALSGSVVNCLTGMPLAATVDLLAPEMREVTTASDGRFQFLGLPLADYRLRAMADGFIASELTGTLDAGNPQQDVRVPLCPPIALRVVLTWGSGPPAPADLDAHLRGPAPGTSVAEQPVEFHLAFFNSEITFPTGGTAVLDLDSRSFSGPETTSVDELAAGRYRYCVHDFSNRDSPQSQGLANSSARVQVFLNDQQLGEFSAPSGPGTVWEVFEIDTSIQPPRLIPVNDLSAQSLSQSVCRRESDRDGDGLTDAQEAALGTSPGVYDSNANGFSDGQDVIDGRDPLPPSTPTPVPSFTPTPPPTATETPVPSPTAIDTPEPSATPTETATPTPTMDLLCGNGEIDGNEQCDDGGTCVGGDNDGLACPAEVGEGVDCGTGVCTPFGGDGCAENCTLEEPRVFTIDSESSKFILQTGVFALPLPPQGRLTWRVGRPRVPGAAGLNGDLPVSIRADEMSLDPVPIAGLVCACVRGVAAKELGPGGSGRGVIACGANGLPGVDIDKFIDHNIGRLTQEECEAAGGRSEGPTDPHPGVCNGPLVVTRSGHGPPGSALLQLSLTIGTIADGGSCATETQTRVCETGSNAGVSCRTNPVICGSPAACVPAKGSDGVPCSEDDPEAVRGAEMTAWMTTGTASARIQDGNLGQIGWPLCDGVPVLPCAFSGMVGDCGRLARDPGAGLSGFGLVSATPVLDLPGTGNNVVSFALKAS